MIRGILFLSIVFVAIANATPKFYGIVNQEMRSVSQDVDVPNGQTLLLTGVDGFESRIGAKGFLPSKNLEVQYLVELGMNSDTDGTDSQQVRVRHAWAAVKAAWGRLKIGQDWLPGTIRHVKSDVLAATHAQSFLVDQSYVQGAQGEIEGVLGQGYVWRGSKNQIAYSIPQVYGLQYTLSVDSGAASYENQTENDQLFIEHLVTFDKKVSAGTFTASMLFGDKSDEAENAVETQYNQLMVRWKGTTYSLTFSTGSQTLNLNQLSDTIQRTYLGADYKLGDLRFAASYSMIDSGDNSNFGTSGDSSIDGADSQVGFGVFYQLHEKAQMRFVLSQYTIARNDTSFALDSVNGITSDTNFAQTAAVGFRVQF